MSCKSCKYACSFDEAPDDLFCGCCYSPYYDDYVKDDDTCYCYARELTEPNEPDPELDNDLISEPPNFS